MRADACLYPYSAEGRSLPVHLTGLGGTAYQQPVRRAEGYFWHQILICTEGRGVLETDAQQPVQEGDAFFLPAGKPHAYWPETKVWDVRWITLDGYALDSLLVQLQMTEPVLIRGGASTLLPFYEKMLDAVTGNLLQWPYICSAQAYSCLMALHTLIAGQEDSRSRILTQTLCFIDENYARDLSLAEMAQSVGVTPQHLCRVFRRGMHMRPGEYLAQRRLQAAQTMLRESDRSLAEIARQVGFASPGYFSTVFRRYMGVSPGAYRRQMRTD